MRFIPLIAVLAVVAFAPAASARVIPPPPGVANTQDLRSPDARDFAAARHAQSLQDLVRLHAGGRIHTSSLAGTYTQHDGPSLAQERYYSSYGKATPLHQPAAADDGVPWDTIAAGIALIAVVAAAVGIAVRTRRRVHVAV